MLDSFHYLSKKHKTFEVYIHYYLKQIKLSFESQMFTRMNDRKCLWSDMMRKSATSSELE